VQGYGLNAVIFARGISEPLIGLIKQMDRQLEDAARRKGSTPLGVFVVFCNDDPGLQQKLQTLVDKEGLKRVVLCATNAAGPPRYRLAREADLTALIYGGGIRTVAANITLKPGKLNEKRTETILKELARVLPR